MASLWQMPAIVYQRNYYNVWFSLLISKPCIIGLASFSLLLLFTMVINHLSLVLGYAYLNCSKQDGVTVIEICYISLWFGSIVHLQSMHNWTCEFLFSLELSSNWSCIVGGINALDQRQDQLQSPWGTHHPQGVGKCIMRTCHHIGITSRRRSGWAFKGRGHFC